MSTPPVAESDTFVRHVKMYYYVIKYAQQYDSLILLLMASNISIFGAKRIHKVALWYLSYTSFLSRYLALTLPILYGLVKSRNRPVR